ncbi:type II secretion system F family protein [Termitidicoccus mucosus]|uniref:Type II secretion system protein GspF domain-containing protein n=1 Tax=Termitidicoccus mucosus TaxID=1184151 RepID=A0A178IQC5_9BACT|nr:hypothetical protein AW736_02485 [Opitutaceae bacterium TSB47]
MKSKLQWDYYVFELRSGRKSRPVEVFAPMGREAALLGVGAQEGELVMPRPLGAAERAVRATLARKRFPAKQLSLLFGEISRFLKVGAPVRGALAVFARQSSSPYIRGVLGAMAFRLAGGSTLLEAMRLFPDVFDTVACSVVSSGEAGGGARLREGFVSLMELFERKSSVTGKVIAASVYPAGIFCALVLGLVAGGMFLLPKMAGTLKNYNVEMPRASQFLMDACGKLRDYPALAVLVVGAAAGFFACVPLVIKSRPAQWLVLRLPGSGPVFRNMILSRVLKVYAMLYESGAAVQRTFEILANVAGHWEYRRYFLRIGGDAARGVPLPAAFFRAQDDIPRDGMRLAMYVKVGEDTASLPFVLKQQAQYMESDLKLFLEMIPPLLSGVLLVSLAPGVLFAGYVLLMPYFVMMQSLVSQISL